MRRLVQLVARRDVHPAIQFLKYGIAGGCATVVDVVLFYTLCIVFIHGLAPDDQLIVGFRGLYDWLTATWPALAEQDWLATILVIDVPPIEEALRKRNYLINRTITAIFSNLAAYLLNRWFVFTPGRHSRGREVALFYSVAIISFIAGTAISYALIATVGVSTTVANLSNLVVAVLINYACRKFIVFKG